MLDVLRLLSTAPYSTFMSARAACAPAKSRELTEFRRKNSRDVILRLGIFFCPAIDNLPFTVIKYRKKDRAEPGIQIETW